MINRSITYDDFILKKILQYYIGTSVVTPMPMFTHLNCANKWLSKIYCFRVRRE